jgi:hypothetical protein
MTREEFIKVLDEKRYSYEIEGDKLVVIGGYVDLNSLASLPPGVEFRNEGGVYLESLTSLSPGVVFKNGGSIDLESLIGGYFNDWKGNIDGIDEKILLNKMISLGLFENKR